MVILSFVKQGDVRTGDKVKKMFSFEDYFALNSQITGELIIGLTIEKQINSFDQINFLMH